MKYLLSLILTFLLSPQTGLGDTLKEAKYFRCQDLLGNKKVRTKIYKKSFVTQFRGQPLEVNYISNRSRLSKSKDLTVVVPGLNMGAFEEKVLALGVGGEQAISLDLTNINATGSFEAPTPEEDAKLLDALLQHLGFRKSVFKKKLYFVNHSRGALVTSRFVVGYHRKYNLGGIVMFNPYMGWIPNYHASSKGEEMSSGLRAFNALMGHIPGVNIATGLAVNLVEEVTSNLMLSAMRLYVNIHDRKSTLLALQKVLHTEDEFILENIRQKLIGMENAEVMEDFQLILELKIPVLIVRSDNDDLVPARQIDDVAAAFGFPVLVFLDADHYLPYTRTAESSDVAIQAIRNLKRRFEIAYGIEAH